MLYLIYVLSTLRMVRVFGYSDSGMRLLISYELLLFACVILSTPIKFSQHTTLLFTSKQILLT